MKFEKHLFISYAHLDNQPLMPEQEGSITRFHASLSAMVSMRLGAGLRFGEIPSSRATTFSLTRSSASFPRRPC
jgi:hypothetical protein